jgi:hypothetical protein
MIVVVLRPRAGGECIEAETILDVCRQALAIAADR